MRERQQGTGVMVVDALRTPIGTAGRAFAALDAAHLAAPVLGALVMRARDAEAPARVADVVLGNCMGPGGDPARVAALTAGLPDEVPAVTVDRQCASGLAAVEIGARMVHGDAVNGVDAHPPIVLAGGVESASSAPWRFWPPADGQDEPRRYERAPFAPKDRDPDMGWAADVLAESRGVSRARQDEYAARSHERAFTSQEQGLFADEIVAVAGRTRDERVRSGLTAARFGRLPAAFRDGGTVTAGNSCGINDGAAAVVLAPERAGMSGLRIVAAASAGVDPALPGLGIVPAVRRVLAAGGLGIDDVDIWEFNEAFAGQVLACCDDLELAEERVCVQGGAIALGHPWGASGAVLVVRLFSQLLRQQAGRYGVAAVAAGGGQGTAVLVEAVHP